MSILDLLRFSKIIHFANDSRLFLNVSTSAEVKEPSSRIMVGDVSNNLKKHENRCLGD